MYGDYGRIRHPLPVRLAFYVKVLQARSNGADPGAFSPDLETDRAPFTGITSLLSPELAAQVPLSSHSLRTSGALPPDRKVSAVSTLTRAKTDYLSNISRDLLYKIYTSFSVKCKCVFRL